MRRSMTRLTIASALVAVLVPARAVEAQEAEFEDVEIFVVHQDTDQDAQVFIAGGSDVPLRTVMVFGPDGELKLKWKVRNDDRLGHADFLFESPEPSLAELKEAYPKGVYAFTGVTVEGTVLMGESRLRYKLLDPPIITYPLEGDTGIPVDNLVATWEEIDGAEAIRFEIEDEEGEVALTVDLDGEATEFTLPNGWLEPGVLYTMDVKAIAGSGNQSVVDVRFTTAD
jgi:hypothetical protein